MTQDTDGWYTTDDPALAPLLKNITLAPINIKGNKTFTIRTTPMLNETDTKYHALLREVMEQPLRGDRTGTGTRSLFGYQMRFQNLDKQFPLLTTKQVYWKGVVAELLWMLKGNTNVKELVDQGVNIWNSWPLKHYNKMMMENFDGADRQITEAQFIDYLKNNPDFEKWGDIGPCYGYQWRKWKGEPYPVHGDAVEQDLIDQMAINIEELKTNPESRRMITLGWNPADVNAMAVAGLPPCHMMVQFYTRELKMEDQASRLGINPMDPNPDGSDVHLMSTPLRYLDAQVYIRSNDLFLGAPFNIAQYALLIHLFAKAVNMIPGELIYTIGDAHIYANHFEQVEEQLARQSPAFEPVLKITSEVGTMPWDTDPADIKLTDYVSHAAIKAPIAV